MAYANGIVRDTGTGLEWKVGPDRKTDWNEAKSWVQNLNLDGGGWRMPTIVELEGLYKDGAGTRNMTSLLTTTGWGVWGGESKGWSAACGFAFSSGSKYCEKFTTDTFHISRAFAVRSRHESKSKGVEVAILPQKPLYSKPSSSTSNVTKRDGIYVAYANGIVKDTNTGFEWVSGPDRDTNWDEAKTWVQSLNLDGGGWRMPTTDELGTLFKKGAGDRNRTPLLKTGGWWVWSGSSATRVFFFDVGGKAWSGTGGGRAFAVRSRNDG